MLVLALQFSRSAASGEAALACYPCCRWLAESTRRRGERDDSLKTEEKTKLGASSRPRGRTSIDQLWYRTHQCTNKECSCRPGQMPDNDSRTAP
jgi:hypothetical protein